MDERAKCKRCGLTIRQFVLMNGKGRKRAAWCALIKGIWTEACPASFWLTTQHKVAKND
jgi:hypothetical protein